MAGIITNSSSANKSMFVVGTSGAYDYYLTDGLTSWGQITGHSLYCNIAYGLVGNKNRFVKIVSGAIYVLVGKRWVLRSQQTYYHPTYNKDRTSLIYMYNKWILVGNYNEGIGYSTDLINWTFTIPTNYDTYGGRSNTALSIDLSSYNQRLIAIGSNYKNESTYYVNPYWTTVDGVSWTYDNSLGGNQTQTPHGTNARYLGGHGIVYNDATSSFTDILSVTQVYTYCDAHYGWVDSEGTHGASKATIIESPDAFLYNHLLGKYQYTANTNIYESDNAVSWTTTILTDVSNTEGSIISYGGGRTIVVFGKGVAPKVTTDGITYTNIGDWVGTSDSAVTSICYSSQYRQEQE